MYDLKEFINKIKHTKKVLKDDKAIMFRKYKNGLYAIIPAQDKIVSKDGIVITDRIGDFMRQSQPAIKSEYNDWHEKEFKGFNVKRFFSVKDML